MEMRDVTVKLFLVSAYINYESEPTRTRENFRLYQALTASGYDPFQGLHYKAGFPELCFLITGSEPDIEKLRTLLGKQFLSSTTNPIVVHSDGVSETVDVLTGERKRYGSQWRWLSSGYEAQGLNEYVYVNSNYATFEGLW